MIVNSRTPVYLVAFFLVAAWAPTAVHAAAYKCVVDGKTTYQGQPCQEQAKSRDAAGATATPTATGGASGASRQDPARRDGNADPAPEPMAREAFAAIKGGNMGAYSALLCPKPRVALSGKAPAEEFKSDGQGFARSKTELGKTVAIDREGVSFQATDAAGSGGKDPNAPRTIRVHFDWIDGKPCVTRIDSSAQTDRK